MSKKTSIIRSCRYCNFIFNAKKHKTEDRCPICNNDSNSAFAIYGKSAYSYLKSQKPYYKSQAILAEEEIAQKLRRIEHQSKTYLRTKVMDAFNIKHDDFVDQLPSMDATGLGVDTSLTGENTVARGLLRGASPDMILYDDLIKAQRGKDCLFKTRQMSNMPIINPKGLVKVDQTDVVRLTSPKPPTLDEMVDKLTEKENIFTESNTKLGIYSSIKSYFTKKDGE
jgi:hypothetical protein